MTIPVILLGPGGNVIDMVDMLEDLNRDGPRYDLLGFLDHRPALVGQTIEGYPVLGVYADAALLAERFPDARFSTWLGGVGSYLRRPAVIAGLGLPPERFVTLVHPTAYVSRRARLGRGVIVFQHCTITNNVTLGDHVVVLPQTVISHDDEIGAYTAITGGVAIAGQVRVGPRCYLGTNCSIHPGVEIGEGCLVGMGSVVLHSTPPFQVVVGNPARKLRDALPPEEAAAEAARRDGAAR
jgi:sugar O-acyltransferase (sialic acid O-acetyltransferase NeuD family)